MWGNTGWVWPNSWTVQYQSLAWGEVISCLFPWLLGTASFSSLLRTAGDMLGFNGKKKKKRRKGHYIHGVLSSKTRIWHSFYGFLFFDQISHMFLTWLGYVRRFIYISSRNIHRLYQQLSEQRQTFLGAMYGQLVTQKMPLWVTALRDWVSVAVIGGGTSWSSGGTRLKMTSR